MSGERWTLEFSESIDRAEGENSDPVWFVIDRQAAAGVVFFELAEERHAREVVAYANRLADLFGDSRHLEIHADRLLIRRPDGILVGLVGIGLDASLAARLAEASGRGVAEHDFNRGIGGPGR
jgi:hypothetical protein